MSKQATEFQRKKMAAAFRGRGIAKPIATGWIDEHVASVREWVANIFFYKKGDQVIMVDAGYNYDRLEEKMGWLGIRPSDIHEILITHEDTDHVGAVERDSPGLFRDATLYIGEIENRYLTGEAKRKVYYHLYTLPRVYIDNKKILVKDGEVFYIGDIRVEAILCPGHTAGHLVFLIDDRYLFMGDTALQTSSQTTGSSSASPCSTCAICWRSGTCTPSSLPATPAGPTTSTLPSATWTSISTHGRSGRSLSTRRHRLTATMSRMTQRSGQGMIARRRRTSWTPPEAG